MRTAESLLFVSLLEAGGGGGGLGLGVLSPVSPGSFVQAVPGLQSRHPGDVIYDKPFADGHSVSSTPSLSPSLPTLPVCFICTKIHSQGRIRHYSGLRSNIWIAVHWGLGWNGEIKIKY